MVTVSPNAPLLFSLVSGKSCRPRFRGPQEPQAQRQSLRKPTRAQRVSSLFLAFSIHGETSWELEVCNFCAIYKCSAGQAGSTLSLLERCGLQKSHNTLSKANFNIRLRKGPQREELVSTLETRLEMWLAVTNWTSTAHPHGEWTCVQGAQVTVTQSGALQHSLMGVDLCAGGTGEATLGL